jgi:putative heme-binding domain-containing protein
MITRRDDPPTHPFASYDAVAASPDRLWQELSDPSWSRRNQAHQELLRRGRRVLEEAADRLRRAGPDDPALEYLVWLAAASRTRDGAELVRKCLVRAEPQVRLQAVRALTEFKDWGASGEVFVPLLTDAHPQVQHAALLALFEFDGPVPKEVVEGPAVSDDTYLRQAAALLLAEKASLEELERLCASGDDATRLAGVLAAGFRLTLPGATSEVPDHLPLDPLRTEEAYAIQFADAKVDLRRLGRIGNYTVADHWKQGGHSKEQERLFSLLVPMLSDADEKVRLQTAHFLSLLNDPRSEPNVLQVVAQSEEQRLLAAGIQGVGNLWVVGPFEDGPDGFDRIHPPEKGPIDLAASYGASGGEAVWQELAPAGSHYDFAKAYAPLADTTFYAYCRLESGSRQRAQLLIGSDDGVRLWHNGRLVWSNDVVRGALPFQDVVTLVLEPGSNDFLARVVNRSGDCGLYLHYRSLREVAAVMPEKLDGANLAERLASAAAEGAEGGIGEEFLKVNWAQAAAAGDPLEGRKLFESAGCIKCHALSGDASTVGGPSLADAGKRFTVPYLVESILLPNKQLSPVFRSTLVQTSDGRQFSGLLVAETAEKVELLLPDAQRQTIAKDEIEVSELKELSPMPQGVLKHPDELKHILAFLLSQ